jgi:hypothetical protein
MRTAPLLTLTALLLPPGALAAQDRLLDGPVAPARRALEAPLAGESVAAFPHFQYVRAFNQGDAVEVAVDPARYPRVIGALADVYVTADRSEEEWLADGTLVDVTGAPTAFLFAGLDIQGCTVTVDTGTLLGLSGTTTPGVGYDVVVDLDRDGVLSGADLIDGGGDEAGFHVFSDLTQDGPYTAVEVLYSGGTWLGQDLYYPANVASLGQLPVLVVSHGNGHNYQWYDHIGYFLASWGWIVMSHQNNTVPGVFSASGTTLSNTDYFLGNLGTIAGGVLQGHVDRQRICWIGHSRGGEGVAIAYDRLYDGTYTPTNYQIDDIQLVSSIAPVDYLGPTQSNPHDVPTFHLWTGVADADVNGCASPNDRQTFHLHDRAEETRLSVSFYGVGHGDFHDGGGSSVAQGPCLVGRANTHTLMKGYLLPLVKHRVEGHRNIRDYLTRQWEDLAPIGAPTSSCVVVDLMYGPGPSTGKLVIDDFQSNPSPTQSSSGGQVSATVSNLTEGRFDDGTNNFTYTPSDPMNTVTLGGISNGTDTTAGIVFDYDTTDASLVFEVLPADQDFTRYDWLSFRSAQLARHPLTQVVLGDQAFEVQLIDRAGTTGTIGIGAFGGGIEEPYQRSGCGIGVGWGADFETIRLPLQGFARNGNGLDLRHVTAIAFLFGPSHGTNEGRLALDEIELQRD